jgi:hypothetical protein
MLQNQLSLFLAITFLAMVVSANAVPDPNPWMGSKNGGNENKANKVSSKISKANLKRGKESQVIHDYSKENTVSLNSMAILPYTFTECVDDLKIIVTALLQDLNHSTGFEALLGGKVNSRSNKNKQLSKPSSREKGSEDFFIQSIKKSTVHNSLHVLEYTIESFTKQVVELCSPMDYNQVTDEFLKELTNGKYSEICYINLADNHISGTYDDNECFLTVIAVYQRIKNRSLLKNKLLSSSNTKSKDDKHSKKDRNSSTARNKHLTINEKLAILKSRRLGDAAQKDNVGMLAKKNNTNNKGVNIKTLTKTETDLRVSTATVPKTVYRVTNRPSLIQDTITTVITTRLTDTTTETKLLTSTILRENTILKTTTFTDVILDVYVSTKVVAKKTIVENRTLLKVITKESEVVRQTTITVAPPDVMVNAAYDSSTRTIEIGADVTHNALLDVTTVTQTVNPLNLNVFSRICGLASRAGLPCPTRSTPTSTQGEQNMNINVNVIGNKGYVKVLKNVTGSNPPPSATATATTTTTVVTTTTSTDKITKTKYKVATKTKTDTTTKTKNKVVTTTKLVPPDFDAGCDGDTDTDNDNDACLENPEDCFNDDDNLEQFQIQQQMMNFVNNSTLKDYHPSVYYNKTLNYTLLPQLGNRSTFSQYENYTHKFPSGSNSVNQAPSIILPSLALILCIMLYVL